MQLLVISQRSHSVPYPSYPIPPAQVVPANVAGWYLAHVDAKIRSGVANSGVGEEVSQKRVAVWCNHIRRCHEAASQVVFVEIAVQGLHREYPCPSDAPPAAE